MLSGKPVVGFPLAAGWIVLLLTAPGVAWQDVSSPPSWQPVSAESFAERAGTWLPPRESMEPSLRAEVRSLLQETGAGERAPLDRAADLISRVWPRTGNLVGRLLAVPSGPLTDWSRPGLLNDPDLPPVVRQTLCLLAGRWLTRHARYDEAVELLTPLPLQHSVDPAALLFYRGLALHRLVRIEESVVCLQQLLENESRLPRRFASLARLMLDDARALKPGSLDEVARLMADVQRRQQLQRSGTRVMGQQEQVLQLLDQLIEDAGQEPGDQQPQETGNPGGGQPMEESRNSGGQGDGEVAEKPLVAEGAWGNLPPRARAAALLEMTRDLPPHYREVIEEYFRQLAREDDDR